MLSDELFSNRILALLNVINAHGLGLWEISDNTVSLDTITSKLLGMSGDIRLGLKDVFALVHRDDRRELDKSLEEIARVPGDSGQVECRLLNKMSKEYSWVRILAKSYLNQGKMIVLGTIQLIEGRALGMFNAMLQNITRELNRKDELNKCIFEITETLLNADEIVFNETFHNCLESIAKAVGLARVYVYKNHIADGTLCCTEIHEWSKGVESTLGESYTRDIPIHVWPGLEEAFTRENVYNRLIKDTPREIQNMTPAGIKAVLFAPIFFKDLLWGFVGYEWAREQLFNSDEETILCSAGLLLANSIIRNDLNKNLYLAVDKINTTAIKAEVLEKFAYTDTLTGLYNRRYFTELAQSSLEKAKRFKTRCYAMMIDIDFFKIVNDSFGHLAGDAVLKNAASVMKNTLRSYDLFCRYGGEEFVVLVTDTKKDAVLHLAERIREAIAVTPTVCNGKEIPVTISIGIAESDINCTIESLVEKADKALYMAKNAGRNCVILYNKKDKGSKR